MAALAIVVTAAMPVKADPVADFYRGKNIILNVGTSPGSGADIAARMVARNLTRHIPGQPNVIVRNMSGGGGLLIFNHLYNKAPKDGTEFSTVVQFPFEYLFDTGSTKALFDASECRWIGGPVNFAAVAVAWNASTKVRKAEDLYTQELVIGASAVASNSASDAYVTRNILGFKYKVVLGYAGGAELDIAMIRGETQGRAQLSWPAIKQRNPEWVSENQISILYQMGLQKSPDIPAHVPLILDFAKNPADRQVLELKFASYSMGYPIFGPPGIPADRLAAMRKALMATLNDPVTRADAAKLRIDVAPVTGETIEDTIAKAHAAPRAIVERLLEASKPPN